MSVRSTSARRLLAAAAIVVAALGVLAAPAFAASGDKPEAAIEAVKTAKEDGAISTATEECVLNALENNDAERCQTAPNPILPATNEILWGGAAFLVLLLVLWKFGLPAATGMMTARTERIRADLDAAETARTEAEGVLTEYREQLAESRTEAGRIIEEARQQAEQVRRDLTARAEAETADLRARNVEQLAAERERVLGELRGQVAGLAVELAEKVVESNLDREANLALIERYIDTVGNGSR
jgi:F-type H+-transporting ATPase subunit b